VRRKNVHALAEVIIAVDKLLDFCENGGRQKGKCRVVIRARKGRKGKS